MYNSSFKLPYYLYCNYSIYFKDAPRQNKKILFDADGEGSNPSMVHSNNVTAESSKNISGNKTTKKQQLFNDEDDGNNSADDDYTANFEVKEQFQGEKGRKLMKLQNRYQGDSRFKLDSKFMENDNEIDNDDNNMIRNTESNSQRNIDENLDDEENERKWQYNILESVVGKKLYHESSRETKKKLVYRLILNFQCLNYTIFHYPINFVFQNATSDVTFRSNSS